MDIDIPDHGFQNPALSESQRRIEIACRLFDTGVLHLWPAAQLAGLDRVHVEMALRKRGIAAYRITAEHVDHDLGETRAARARRGETAA